MMEEIDRHALDCEKIAAGAGTPEERMSAIDLKIDDCVHEIQVRPLNCAQADVFAALAGRLTRLRPALTGTQRRVIDRAIGRLRAPHH